MSQCSLRLISLIIILAAVACAKSDDQGREHTFVTNGPQRYSDDSDQGTAPKEVPFFVREPERQEVLPAFEVPEQLRERINQEIPNFVPLQSTKFRVLNHNLKINVNTSTMTFTGTLKIDGKADEAIELTCKFDKTKTWTCGDMFPTNPAVARERRLQAVVNCLDMYNCDQVGLELFVRINGRTESQLFQSAKFEIRRASSGDVEERGPLVRQKPTPGGGDPQGGPLVNGQPKPPRTGTDEDPLVSPPPITDEELQSLMNDPNAAVEVTSPIPVPAPIRGEFSIPDIERLRPEIGVGVPNQAIGAHHSGRLVEAAKLPRQGPGFIARPGRESKSYGTNLMIGLLSQVSAQMEQAVPNKPPLVVSNISSQAGGRLCNGGSCHKSHQTGLDVDVSFPSHRRETSLWSACDSEGPKCRNGISRNFDPQRFWIFAKQAACAENNPVIVIFVDTAIKRHMCNWVKTNTRENINDPNSCAAKTLSAMKYSPGHHNHFHMRLRCPGNRDCRNATVSLSRGSGC